MTATGRRLSVLLSTEGTYPYHKGGVSTWCHVLTRKLSDMDFTILAVTMNPYAELQYALAPNVRRLITVPLWGTEDPAEYGWYDSAGAFLAGRWQTTSRIVASRFVPVYERFLREAMARQSDAAGVASTAVRLYQHFAAFDYHRTMTNRAVWEAFTRVAGEAWERDEPDQEPPALGELAEAWRLLYRLLTVLAAPIPRTDVTHAAAAAFCGLPCVVAKLQWGTPYLLTEHGVYLREQYLNLPRAIRSGFVRWFLLRVISAVVDLSYAFADQLSPVCQYNTRWEQWRRVEPGRIHVIYNGVDPDRFSADPDRSARQERPLVVNVGLIFPLKGQLDLIEAAGMVRCAVPDVEFRLYGSPSDRVYYAQCEARIRALGLGDTVRFACTTNEPWEAYRRASVVAMASISEAFPYSVIESMLCEAAVVATDVGGVREALGQTGVLVAPRDPMHLARAITRMLESPNERRRLGEAARLRALRYFTEDRFIDEYRTTYQQLAESSRQRMPEAAHNVLPLSAGEPRGNGPRLYS
jgi:glycosyltransferase involved in cell wall biosynthesis